MGVSIELEGMDELINRIEAMGNKTSQAINPILIAAAQPVLDDVQRTAAYIDHSGHLRGAMKKSNVKVAKGIKSIWVGDVDKTANYSWYVEFGHSKAQSTKNMSARDKFKGKLNKVTEAAAHPFMQPGFDRNKQEVRNIMKQMLQDILK